MIVPTIALIDETRRRPVKRFKDFNLKETVPDTTNVYLLTQERVMQRPDLADVEFLVLDEFYKIDLANDKDESTGAVDLSLAFHKLAKTGAQLYMLGPLLPSQDWSPHVAGKSVQFRQRSVLVTAIERFFGLGGAAFHVERLAAGLVPGLSLVIAFLLSGL